MAGNAHARIWQRSAWVSLAQVLQASETLNVVEATVPSAPALLTARGGEVRYSLTRHARSITAPQASVLPLHFEWPNEGLMIKT